MRMHPTPFPETRQNNAKHQAELLVYQTLSRSAAPGLALYGFHPDRNAPESDFLLWLEGVAHFNIEVKGSEYTLENGMWRLHSCHGSEKVSSPLTQAWDSAVSVRSAVRSKLGRRIFVYSVLLFTDMDGDPAIQEAADSNNRTHLLWRVRPYRGEVVRDSPRSRKRLLPTPQRRRYRRRPDCGYRAWTSQQTLRRNRQPLVFPPET